MIDALAAGFFFLVAYALLSALVVKGVVGVMRSNARRMP